MEFFNLFGKKSTAEKEKEKGEEAKVCACVCVCARMSAYVCVSVYVCAICVHMLMPVLFLSSF